MNLLVSILLFSFTAKSKPFERKVARVNEYRYVTSISFESVFWNTHFGADTKDVLYLPFTIMDRTISYQEKSVLSEGPIDINPDQTARDFAQVKYHGRGLIIRLDRRGADPRLNSKASIIRNGYPDCVLSAKLLFTPL